MRCEWCVRSLLGHSNPIIANLEDVMVKHELKKYNSRRQVIRHIQSVHKEQKVLVECVTLELDSIKRQLKASS